MMDPLKLSASHLAHEIATEKISSERYCRLLLEEIEDHKHLNAYTHVDSDLLLETALAADKALQAGTVHGPLHGIPLIIKDNINTAGLPTSGGTPALQSNQPGSDAPLVAALRKAGALIAGKANLHELSSGGTSANHTFGPVRNPYDVKRVPGGSSGGTAAAVAAHLAPAGMGTDTAGSVRVPASLCGLFGFRPTVGRYSASGIVPLSTSLDTAGPLARSMDDIILLDSVLAQQAGDVTETPVSTLRLGVAENVMADAASETAAVVDYALKTLERAVPRQDQWNRLG